AGASRAGSSLTTPNKKRSNMRGAVESRNARESEARVKLWISVVVAGLCLARLGPAAQGRTLVLEGGTLIDGAGRDPTTDALVVVEGTRIKAVGRRSQVTYPPGAAVIRLDGRTILPGLIDGHVHLRDWQLPMFLPYGVTTIADIHNDTTWSIAQREALKSGKIKG